MNEIKSILFVNSVYLCTVNNAPKHFKMHIYSSIITKSDYLKNEYDNVDLTKK